MSVIVVLFCAMTTNPSDCRVSPYDKFESAPLTTGLCSEKVLTLVKSGGPSGGYYAIVNCRALEPSA